MCMEALEVYIDRLTKSVATGSNSTKIEKTGGKE